MRGKRRKRGKGTAGLSDCMGLKELHHLSRSHSCWSILFSGEGGKREDMSPMHTLPELLLKVAGMANRRATTEFLGCQGEATLAFCCLEKWVNEMFWSSKLHFSHGLHCYSFISNTLYNFSSLMGRW